ncbi:haloacid dehalogenase [Neofusicoccum parvum]|nr:haloacid dehalogenase [Neofusicoccum parvum]
MPTPKPSQKNLLIAFDAFGTLFTPRAPIGTQYGEIARKHGICKDVSDDEIMNSFKKAFKLNAKERPNYGKEVGMDPTAWWSSIITQTFTPFLPSPAHPLPARLVPALLARFASRSGYTLYPDVVPLFASLRALRNAAAGRRIVTAVVTNSDDRVAGILRSFGLRVGHVPYPLGGSVAEQGEGWADNDVDFVLTSYDCGCEKPQRGIFDAAVEVAGARFGGGGGGGGGDEGWDTVYVGDEVDKDVVGAEGAGWDAAFLVNREGVVEKEGDGVVVVRRNDLGGQGEEEVRVLRDLRNLSGYVGGANG